MSKQRSGRYVEGAINRQKVLDYVNEHQGATAVEILTSVQIGTSNGSTMLRRMTEMGELSRVKAEKRASDFELDVGAVA